MFVFLLAQAAAVPAAVETQGVTSYPLSFFTAQSPANAQEMIARVPGFTLDNGAAVRGYDGAAGNVLIDGQRPSTKTDSIDEILRRIPADEVERIEVIRGGAPGIDMQGKAVIANVIRTKTGGLHGVIAAAVTKVTQDGRAVPNVRLEANGDRDGRHWEVSARGLGYVDDGSGVGFSSSSDGAGRPLSNADLDTKGGGRQATLTGAYDLPAYGGALHVNGRLYWDLYRFKETDDVSFPAHVFQHDNFRQNRFDTEAGGRYTHDLGPRDSLEVVALRQSERLTQSERFDASDDQTVFSAANDTSEAIIRAALKHTRSPTLSFEAGVEGAFNTLDAQQRFSENGVAVALPAANVQIEETRWEAFGRATWRIVKPVTLEAEVRQEGSTLTSRGDVALQKTLSFTKPRLALSWDVTSNTQIRLRYERVVGQLNFSDFVASSSLSTGVLTAGNPNLNPEQDWVSEIALERRFWKAGSVSFTYRRSEITDAQDRAPVFSSAGVFDAPANIGKGLNEEFILDATIPLDRFGVKGGQLRGTGTRRNSEVTDPTTGQRREISGLLPVQWEAHFSQDLPRWRTTWGVDAFGETRWTNFRFNEIETKKLTAYLAPFVEWKPKPDTSFRLEVDNALAHHYRDILTHYDGARSTAPIAFVRDRDRHFGPEIFFRVRKTVG